MALTINLPLILFCGRESALHLIKRGVRFLNTSLPNNLPQKNPITLSEQLKSRIEIRGPLTVADYMRAVLTSPSGGYYMSRDVLGRQGDFTTSPEISQLFGDMVGVWFTNEVKKIYDPSLPLQLVELGPGRGTLTTDVLKVFKQLRGKEGLSVHLVEISPEFSRIQAEKLCKKGTVESTKSSVFQNSPDKKVNGRHYTVGKGDFSRIGASFNAVTVQRPESLQTPSEKYYQKGVMEDGTPVFWYYSINEVPYEFSCFLAHEFFDALPIHKFKKTSEGWREVLITTDPTKGPEGFKFIISRSGTPASKIFMKPWDEREEAEICPDTGLIAQQIATRLERSGGTALIIDYGYEDENCDTFRAFRKHKQVDPLVCPGTADLTADVDFTYLRNAVMDKSLTFGPVTQSSFLKEIGIDLRLQMLLDTCPQEQRSHLESGYRMIMNSMGERFKIFSMFPLVLKEHLEKFPVSGFPKA